MDGLVILPKNHSTYLFQRSLQIDWVATRTVTDHPLRGDLPEMETGMAAKIKRGTVVISLFTALSVSF
jgi:hypothetical protein